MVLRPSSMARWIVFLAAASLLLTPASARCAPPSHAEVKRISLLPEAEQRTTANQAVLQAWFLPRVTEFQEILTGTAVGSQVRLGDLNTWKRRFAPPAGTGDWVIVWQYRPGVGPTKEPREPFYIPSDAFDFYFKGEGSVSTCWHEVQHGLLGDYWLSAPGFWAATQEHYYIEDHVQNIVLWLHELTNVEKFETYVRQAGAKADQLRANGVRIDLAMERGVWAIARAAWLSRYDGARKVNTPPPALRDEYVRITGVRAPSVEEVVAFYMRGGVRKEKGAPIPVPEWVLSADENRGVVAIQHDPSQDVIEAKADLARYRFAVRVVDPRKKPGDTSRSDHPVSRGLLVLTLENDDDDARIDVSAGGRPVAGMPLKNGTSRHKVEVDFRKLPGGTRPGGFLDVAFTRNAVRSLRGKTTFRIVAEYLDPGTPADPAVYHPSRAVFFVDVTPPGAAPASAAPKGPASPATAAGGNGGGAFRLAKEERTGSPCEHHAKDAHCTTDWSGKLDASRFRTSNVQECPGLEPRRRAHSFDGSFVPPPAVLHPGDVLTLQATADVKCEPRGDELCDGIRSLLRVRVPPSPFHAPIDQPGRYEGPEVSLPPRDRQTGSSSGSTSTRIQAPKLWPMPPDTKPLEVRVAASGPHESCAGLQIVYHYEWTPGGAAAPTDTRVETRSEIPPEPPTPASLDEVPPKDGDVVPVLPASPPGKVPPAAPPTVRRTPTPPPAAAGRWYVHPQGGYRFPLPNGYDLRQKTNLGEPDAGYDTVFAPGESSALVAARGSEDVARKDPVEFLAAWGANVARGDRSAVVRKQLIGGAPGVFVETFSEGVATHHVAFVSAGRAYHLSAAFPSPRAAPLPKEIRALLDGLVPGK